MTLEELDKKLASLQSDLEAIRKRTETLETSVTYMTAQANQLSGITEQKFREASARVAFIWAYRTKMRELLDAAQAKRANMPSVFRGNAIDEIVKLLDGESIKVEKCTTAGCTALEEFTRINAAQSLFAASTGSGGNHDIFSQSREDKTTVTKVKEAIAAGFRFADELMAQLRQRWIDLEVRVSHYEQQLNTMKASVTAMGKPVPSELSDFEARVKTMVKKKTSDPLSITAAEVDQQLDSYCTRTTIRVQSMERELELVANDVRVARQKLEDLKVLRGTALDLSNRCLAEIRNEDLVANPPKSKPLGDALDLLDTAVREKRFTDASNGLLTWHRDAQHFERDVNATITANRALIDRKSKLMERWAEAKRKVEINKHMGLADDRALSRFAQKIVELTTDKVDVTAVETFIYSYETRVGELIASWSNRTPRQILEERWHKLKARAQEKALDSNKALTAFAGKVDEALTANDIDAADQWVNSYETKLGELIAKGATAAPSNPPEPPARTTPPVVAPSRQEQLQARLDAAVKKAADNGFGDKKSLNAFAGKAREALAADDLDTADSMVNSFEVKLQELLGHAQ